MQENRHVKKQTPVWMDWKKCFHDTKTVIDTKLPLIHIFSDIPYH